MFPGMAKWQPYLFGLGMCGFSLFMMGAGTLGVPRRHWDMTLRRQRAGLRVPGHRLPDDGADGDLRPRGDRRRRDVPADHRRQRVPRQADRDARASPTSGRRTASRRRRSRSRSAITVARQQHRDGGVRRAGNVHARDGVPDLVRPLLLRQLEVPVDGVAAVELRRPGPATRPVRSRRARWRTAARQA